MTEATDVNDTDLDPAADAQEPAADVQAGATELGEATVDESAPVTTDPEEPVVRPREVVKGIHPEIRCQCVECEPDYTELQWFSVDETRKVKGTAMLYCQHSSRKYFSPVPALQAWLTDHPPPRTRRGS